MDAPKLRIAGYESEIRNYHPFIFYSTVYSQRIWTQLKQKAHTYSALSTVTVLSVTHVTSRKSVPTLYLTSDSNVKNQATAQGTGPKVPKPAVAARAALCDGSLRRTLQILKNTSEDVKEIEDIDRGTQPCSD